MSRDPKCECRMCGADVVKIDGYYLFGCMQCKLVYFEFPPTAEDGNGYNADSAEYRLRHLEGKFESE